MVISPIHAKALATAAAGLSLPPLWFGMPGVAVLPPAKVRSLNLPTHTCRCLANLSSALFDSVHDNARQTVPSHFFKITSPVSRQTSCRASSIHHRASCSRQISTEHPSPRIKFAANILSSTEHPSPHIKFAANILVCAAHPASPETSRCVPSIQPRSAYPVGASCRAPFIQSRGKHPVDHRTLILSKHPVEHGALRYAANIPLRVAHPAISSRIIPTSTTRPVLPPTSCRAPCIQSRRDHFVR